MGDERIIAKHKIGSKRAYKKGFYQGWDRGYYNGFGDGQGGFNW